MVFKEFPTFTKLEFKIKIIIRNFGKQKFESCSFKREKGFTRKGQLMAAVRINNRSFEMFYEDFFASKRNSGVTTMQGYHSNLELFRK